MEARERTFRRSLREVPVELDGCDVVKRDESSDRLLAAAATHGMNEQSSGNTSIDGDDTAQLPAVTSPPPIKDQSRRSNFVTQCSHPYPLISAAGQAKLMREFSHRRQLQKILGKGFLLWLRTVAILLLLGFVLWEYHRKPVMSLRDKNAFNVLMTAGSILLGLNVAAALNEMTMNMRWFFLSRKKQSLKEVDTIIRSDISKLDSYFLQPRPWAAGIPILWLLINIGSQIGVSCLGLTYSIDYESRAVFLTNGNVNVTNLGSFFAYGSSNDTLEQDVRWAANNFGNTALLSSPYDSIDKAPAAGDAYNSVDSKIWLDPGVDENGYWHYRFLASTSEGTFQPGLLPAASVYTDRTINATWSCCAWRVLSPSGNGSSINITYIDDESTGHTLWYLLPVVQAAQTSFWTASQVGYTDPRMAHVMAFEPDFTNPWLYSCNITVSPITNAVLPEHKISDSMAFTAGTSIALGALDVLTLQGNTTVLHRTQRYPQQPSGYGAKCRGNYQLMGMNIAHFAIGAISVADKFNPRLTLPSSSSSSSSLSPRTGFSLTIPQVSYVISIFALVLGAQLVLLLVTSFVANQVVITADSPLAVARLLDPFVARLNMAGSIAEEGDVVAALEREDADGRMMVGYTVHVDEKERWRVVLSDERTRRAMDDGRYY